MMMNKASLYLIISFQKTTNRKKNIHIYPMETMKALNGKKADGYI